MRWLLVALGLADPPCSHFWEEQRIVKVHTPGIEYPTAHVHVLRCKACGDIKHYKVSF